jgi:hypothetical protein
LHSAPHDRNAGLVRRLVVSDIRAAPNDQGALEVGHGTLTRLEVIHRQLALKALHFLQFLVAQASSPSNRSGTNNRPRRNFLVQSLKAVERGFKIVRGCGFLLRFLNVLQSAVVGRIAPGLHFLPDRQGYSGANARSIASHHEGLNFSRLRVVLILPIGRQLPMPLLKLLRLFLRLRDFGPLLVQRKGLLREFERASRVVT